VNILITEKPNQANSYIDSLANAYKKNGNFIIFTPDNFYYSNFIPHVIHINWPESLYKWQFKSFKKDVVGFISERLDFFKNSGSIIINTIHNLEPHEIEESSEKDIYDLIIRESDIIVHHGNKSIDMLHKFYPSSQYKLNTIAPHGDYLLIYEKREKRKLREKYGIPKNSYVILNFGNIRPHKGERFLDKVFQNLNIKKKFLITAGNFYTDHRSWTKLFENKIKKKIRSIPLKNKYRIDRRITNNEISDLFNLADLLVLGHSKGLTTGLIPLAATFSLPVAYPDLGNFKEQAKNWSDFFYKPNNKDDATEIIERAYSLRHCSRTNRLWLKQNSWEIHASIILDSVEKHRQSGRIQNKIF
jgi:hypothetical protein